MIPSDRDQTSLELRSLSPLSVALWENATKSFGIFSSNLGLIGVSIYNLVEILVQIVPWYLKQDSFDCK